MVDARLALDDWHEVDDLADPIGGHEPSDQDRGVREIQLSAYIVVPVRRDVKVPSALVVEQDPKTLGESKRGKQKPIDGAVGTDEGRRL